MKRTNLFGKLLAGTLTAALSLGLGMTAFAEEVQTEAASDVISEDAASDEASEDTASDELPAISRVSVHDPSIIKSEDGTYYVLGSHTASAKSDDLIAWTQVNFDYGNPENTPFYGNLQEMFAEPFQWAGYNDGDCTGGYAI